MRVCVTEAYNEGDGVVMRQNAEASNFFGIEVNFKGCVRTNQRLTATHPQTTNTYLPPSHPIPPPPP